MLWDLYPEHLVHANIFREDSAVVRSWHHLNRVALSHAEFVVILGPTMERAVKSSLGKVVRRPRLHVIPNFADTDELTPQPKRTNAFAAETGQTGLFTVLYSGNVGASHDLSGILDAAAALQHERRIGFLVVGDGLGLAGFMQAVRDRGLNNVTFAPRQAWSRLSASLGTGDLAVVAQAPGSEHLSVPSKTYSALAVGCPILALTEPGSDLARVVQEHGVGVVCNPRDGTGIANAVGSLLDNPDQAQKLRRAARDTAVRHYSLQGAATQFRNLLAPYLGTS